MKPAIRWSGFAEKQLEDIIEFIAKDSYKNSIEVRNKIFQEISTIPDQPYKFPRDHYKLNNSGNFRVLFVYRFRITYEIENDFITIVQVIHAFRRPKMF